MKMRWSGKDKLGASSTSTSSDVEMGARLVPVLELGTMEALEQIWMLVPMLRLELELGQMQVQP